MCSPSELILDLLVQMAADYFEQDHQGGLDSVERLVEMVEDLQVLYDKSSPLVFDLDGDNFSGRAYVKGFHVGYSYMSLLALSSGRGSALTSDLSAQAEDVVLSSHVVEF